MDEVDRLPCPLCAEPIAVEARLCPHCRSSALVDLALEGASPQDARQRYQVARAVSGLGAPFPSLAAVRDSLAGGGPAAWNVTQGEARRAVEALQRLKIAAKTAPASGRGQFTEVEVDSEESWFRRPVLRYGLAAAAVVAGFVMWRRTPAPVASPVRPAVVPVARSAPAVVPGAAEAPLSNAALARKALPSIVSLRCGDSIGSGFFVAPDLVMTNAHVLCGSANPVTVVFSDGRRATGSPSRTDERLDLALVQVAGTTGPPLELGDAGTLSAGERVMMIGSPLGLEFTVHQASVSNLSRPILGVSYLQIEARINPGNSGGPLLDSRGRVVAVVSLKQTDAEGIGFALPINYAFADQGGFVPGPGAPTSVGFASMLTTASESDRDAQLALEAVELRPVVAAASTDQYRRLVVRIVYPARGPLGYTDLRFKLLSGGNAVCSMSAGVAVADWKVLERKQQVSGMDARANDWLGRLGFDVKLYQAEVPLMMSQCGSAVRSGTALELEGADPRASRVAIR